MRPEAPVDPVGIEHRGDRRGGPAQQGSELGDMHDVPGRLDDHGPQPERADAMLHRPVGAPVQATTG
ncbi:MAG: hypothetical protein L0Y54_23100 [Sporichthyaceae bacterium]|nr:hypothetical protein [Sporichthyaceae bacterium]